MTLSGCVVKIVERCNLNCSYCYMYNHVDQSYKRRPHFMSAEVFGLLLDRIEEYLSHAGASTFSLILHGGEPMLMPLDQIEAMLSTLRRRLGGTVAVGMQTNGTLMTSEWAELLTKYGVSLGVSLDGIAADNDRFRIDHAGKGSYDRAVAGLRLMQAHGLSPSVLCVIAPGRDGLATYKHFRELGIKRMDFLLPELAYPTWRNLYEKTYDQPIARFLIPIFDSWFGNDEPDVEIRLFTAVIKKLLGGRTTTQAIGGEPARYMVVETDGSLHANDCLKVCWPELSDTGLNLHTNGLADLSHALPLPLRVVLGDISLAKVCTECSEVAVCGGGTLPNRYSPENDFDNPSIWCGDLKELLGHIRTSIYGKP